MTSNSFLLYKAQFYIIDLKKLYIKLRNPNYKHLNNISLLIIKDKLRYFMVQANNINAL